MTKTVLEEKRNHTLYTTREVAQMMKLHPQTLIGWRHTGQEKLDFVQIGRAIRYRHVDVVEFIAARTRQDYSDDGT